MPVLCEDSNLEGNKRSNRKFVRIQNLPWTASHSEIKNFFCGLSIGQGGILVRNFEAFVAFENPTDVRLALYRRNILLHGRKLELSVINEAELQKILFNIVRRKLDFEDIKKRVVSNFYSQPPPRRKIRPTPVLKEDKRRSASYSTFLPEETDFFSCDRRVEYYSFAGLFRRGKRSVGGIRKLHPTSVPDTMEMKNLAVFHPEECFETKRIKLE